MLKFRIDKPVTAEQFEEYYELRWRILRAPWDQPRGSERDELEDVADHVWAIAEPGQLVGVGRLHLNSRVEGQIRYMAVEPDFRGLGVGRAIVEQLESEARRHQVERVVLNARHGIEDFYHGLGYQIIGDGPILFGNVKHFRMQSACLG